MENVDIKKDNLVPQLDTVSMRRTLQGLKAREKKIFVWQNRGQERTGVDISSGDFIFGDKMMVFNKEAAGLFSPDLPLYFFAGPNTIIFKSKIVNVKPEHIVLEYPDSMQIEDARETKRFYFKLNSKYLNISKKNKNSTPTRYRVSLHDLSVTGASFTLTEMQKQNIESTDELKLHSVDDQILSPYLNASLRYIVPFKVLGTKLYKVGIHFDRELTASEIKTVL